MVIELITGHADAKHVSALDAANFNIGVFGADIYQLVDKANEWKQPRVKNANTIIIPSGNWLIHGRHVRIDTEMEVTIESGQSGYKRIDLIVFHYTQDAQGIEKVTLEVVKGTATTGNPTVPSITSPAWSDEQTTDSRFAYAKVVLNGLTPSVSTDISQVHNSYLLTKNTIKLQENVTGLQSQITSTGNRVTNVDNRITSVNDILTSNLRNVESQVTSLQATKSTTVRLPYQTGGAYTLTREGNIVTLGGQGTCDNVQNAGNVTVNETIPTGYCPTATTAVSWGGNQKMDMLIKPDGTITLLGNAYGWVHIGASWITHDLMPS
ncbi:MULTISPECIES: hypothetical protein [Actinomycetes]|uniref:hypothetical protein n=1 Tax=Actinomycetes TaxID=1760 RepID=UPI0003B77218|nr:MULTISPECIES: hypothetical protein [Actinomycetes]